jgi:hypothetical protein
MIFLIGSRFLGAPRKRHPVYPSSKSFGVSKKFKNVGKKIEMAKLI